MLFECCSNVILLTLNRFWPTGCRLRTSVLHNHRSIHSSVKQCNKCHFNLNYCLLKLQILLRPVLHSTRVKEVLPFKDNSTFLFARVCCFFLENKKNRCNLYLAFTIRHAILDKNSTRSPLSKVQNRASVGSQLIAHFYVQVDGVMELTTAVTTS